MGCSFPSTTWESTPNSATSEASLSKMHGKCGYGNAGIGVLSKVYCSLSNASCDASVHRNFVLLVTLSLMLSCAKL